MVVLISGRGSNMVAIARACQQQAWPATIASVIANRPDAAGLATARALGLSTEVVDHRAFADRARFDAALAATIDAHGPSLVVLAGFMRVLGDAFVQRYAGRLVNIHPSLLPAFPGLDTHRRALAAGVKVHGATVHLVTPDVDTGPILAQAAVPVLPDDDPDTLADRVQRAEHRLYPQVLRAIVEGRLQLSPQGASWMTPVADPTPQALWCP